MLRSSTLLYLYGGGEGDEFEDIDAVPAVPALPESLRAGPASIGGRRERAWGRERDAGRERRAPLPVGVGMGNRF